MNKRALIALCLVIAVLGAGSMMTACGHKGELYLPDRDEQQGGEGPS